MVDHVLHHLTASVFPTVTLEIFVGDAFLQRRVSQVFGDQGLFAGNGAPPSFERRQIREIVWAKNLLGRPTPPALKP
jgi:hypothetical protein